MKTYLVTGSPPTPNGDLHIGHLAGPYLAADVFSRFQRMRGNRCVYLSSSDGNQSFVVTTAERLGRDPIELAAEYGRVIQQTLQQAEIELDCFTEALGNHAHIEQVQTLFCLLFERGIIVPKVHGMLYCDRCARHLFESFVRGWCPYCGQVAGGNLCEACGRVYDPLRLIDPRCSRCGSTPSIVQHRSLVLPLERFRSQLEAYHASRRTWRPHLRGLSDALLAEPLADYPVSYPASWGIPVPVEGFQDQVINVWLEMYAGYIQTTRTWASSVGTPELADRLWGGEATLVQFHGYDNSFCSSVLHTTVALALDRTWLVPEHIITNEFYFLEGEKFSTSRDHVVWGHDILEAVPADVLRYHLCRTNPECWQTNFSVGDLVRTGNEELRGTWNTAIDDLMALATTTSIAGVISIDLQVRGLIGWTRTRLEQFYDVDGLSLRHASVALRDYVEAAGEYARRVRGEATISQLAGVVSLLAALALFAAPMMPAFADRLWTALGLEGCVANLSWDRIDGPFFAHPSAPNGKWFALTNFESLITVT